MLEMSDVFVFYIKAVMMFLSRKKKDVTSCFKTSLRSLDLS